MSCRDAAFSTQRLRGFHANMTQLGGLRDAIPLHNGIVSRLRDMIIRCELRPGERISEKALGELFKVSRTPLREALKILASEDLIAIRPHRGSVVTEVSSRDIAETFAVMGALETFAAPLTCDRVSNIDIAAFDRMLEDLNSTHQDAARETYFELNKAFHATIVRLSDNAVLAATYGDLFGKIERARHLANLNQSRWDESLREHASILQALRRRDKAAFVQRLADHNRRTADAVLAKLSR
jgi:DNA-binding GntR family transcriptional regulator